LGLILEILFLIAGLWLIISGKIPLGLFKALFGKGLYITTPSKSRLLGLLLASPLPVVLSVSAILRALFGQDGVFFTIIFEIGYLFVVAIVSIVLAKRIRQPEPVQKIPQSN
jgi:hypothetical protein